MFGDEYNGSTCIGVSDHRKSIFYSSSLEGNKPPCQEIDSVDYTTDEVIGPPKKKYGHNEYISNYFELTLEIRKSYYKAVIQKREVDLQTLIGNIGGYIGIFTGFALTQIPDMLFTLVGFTRRRLAKDSYCEKSQVI